MLESCTLRLGWQRIGPESGKGRYPGMTSLHCSLALRMLACARVDCPCGEIPLLLGSSCSILSGAKWGCCTKYNIGCGSSVTARFLDRRTIILRTHYLAPEWLLTPMTVLEHSGMIVEMIVEPMQMANLEENRRLCLDLVRTDNVTVSLVYLNCPNCGSTIRSALLTLHNGRSFSAAAFARQVI